MTLKFNKDGYPYEDPTAENKKLQNRIKELDNSLSIALDINNKYQRENVALKKEVEELKADLARAKEDHQYDNLVHQKELESLRKK